MKIKRIAVINWAENLFSYGILKNKNLYVGLISYFSLKFNKIGLGNLKSPWGKAFLQFSQKK